MPVKIIPIVEGHGEVAAVPVLLRRIAKRLNAYDVQVGKPIRCQRHNLSRLANWNERSSLLS